MKHARQRRLTRGKWSALAILALGLTILGADKSPATRALQRFLSRGRTDAVTSAEIACGYRVTGTDAGGPVEMPAGVVTNELLRRRGGFDWAFRVEPNEEWRMENGEWRVPWKGGYLTGVTVFARGEVRPDVGTLYFPVPVTNGVSLLPEARWGMLSHAEAQRRGEGSIFSHAVTTNGSLLLDWRNALVGRDPNSPTNLQMELFSDGGFVWRTDGGSTSYLPVLPFDWDGDGLENSVDPEPLSPNPVDAHGTSAEWYRVVCSNVFETAGGDLGWKEGVNSNAYYFVDVVAEEGPAPIWFNADRDSRLGSPVVVAWGGETNRVPLLIGVEYSVTSTVPISVSAPDFPYVILIPDNDYAARVRWPLDFTFVEDTDAPGAYTVEVVPYDPGVAFTWNSPTPGGGASRLSADHSPFSILHSSFSISASSCSCWGGSGPSVVFDCSDNCDCGGGCQASGTGGLEEAEFAVTGGVCRCSRPDEPHEDEPPPPPDPLVGGLSVSFSKGAVIFEDEYRNTENGPLVPRRSTTTRLTVSASGGPFGGSFTLTTRNLEKLIVADGPGPVALTSGMTLGPYETYSATFACAGVAASGAENDVEVEGTFTENVTGWTESPRAQTTVVRVELKAKKTAPANPCPNRHVFGVFEKVELKHRPSSASVFWEMSGGGETSTSEEGYVGENWGGADWMLRCPLYAKGVGLKATCGGVEWPFDVMVLEPSGLRVEPPRSTDFDPYPDGYSGAGMHVVLYLQPETVDFQEISLQEIPVEDVAPQNDGCFTNFPQSFQTHTFTAGAGRWRSPDEQGRWGRDHVSCEPIPRQNTPPGWQYLYLPWGWNKKVDYMIDEGVNLILLEYESGQPYTGGQCYKEVSTRYDSMDRVLLEGTTSVNRYDLECMRMTNGVYFLNGNLVK